MDDEKDAQELANMTYGHSKYEAYKVDLSISNPTESFMIFVSPETKKIEDVVYCFTEFGYLQEERLTPEEFENNYWFFKYLVYR